MIETNFDDVYRIIVYKPVEGDRVELTECDVYTRVSETTFHGIMGNGESQRTMGLLDMTILLTNCESDKTPYTIRNFHHSPEVLMRFTKVILPNGISLERCYRSTDHSVLWKYKKSDGFAASATTTDIAIALERLLDDKPGDVEKIYTVSKTPILEEGELVR